MSIKQCHLQFCYRLILVNSGRCGGIAAFQDKEKVLFVFLFVSNVKTVKISIIICDKKIMISHWKYFHGYLLLFALVYNSLTSKVQ